MSHNIICNSDDSPMDNKQVRPLYWWVDSNRIEGEFGDIIYNPFRYVTPMQLLMFKEGGEPVAYIPSRFDKNEIIELIMCGK